MFAKRETVLRGLGLAFAIAVCVFAAVGCGQNADDPVVIKMKGGDIRFSAFREAYDGINGEGTFDNATIPERLEFAETWAIKEMLLIEAKKHVKEPSRTTEVQLTRYRERFLETAFWKQMSDGVTLPGDTLNYYRESLRKQMLLSVIQVPTEEQARELLGRVQAGESFETLARLHSTDRYSREGGGRTGWIGKGGGFLPLVANYAFENLEKGQISPEPVETVKGFHIVRVDDVRTLESTPENEQNWLVTARQTYFRNLTRAVKDSMAKHRKFVIHEEAIETLGKVFKVYWDSLNTVQAETGGVDYLTLEPPRSNYWTPEEWSMPLLSFDDQTWTIGDFVESLRQCDLEFWPTKGTTDQLLRSIRRRMLRHFAVESAVDWGWEKDPWYLEKMERQRQKRLLEDYHDRVLAKDATITQEDIDEYYEANKHRFVQDDMVDFGFMLFPLDAEEQAMQALVALKRGGDWEGVGENQILDNPEVSFVPATGLNPGDQYPELARRAKELVDTGRLPLNRPSDPVQTPKGWAILRVTSRVPGTPMEREWADPAIRAELTDQWAEKVLAEKLPGLRAEYGLEIIEEALEKDLVEALGGSTS